MQQGNEQILKSLTRRPNPLPLPPPPPPRWLTNQCSFSIKVKNPLPVDALLKISLPSTFIDVDPNIIETSMDGTFSFSVASNWEVSIKRNGDGSIIAAGSSLNFQMNRVRNPANVGQTNKYSFVSFLGDDSTIIDVGDSGSILIDKQVTNVGVSFGASDVAVVDQRKKWFFHGFGMNADDEIKWIDSAASQDNHCEFMETFSQSKGVKLGSSSSADEAVEFDVLFSQNSQSHNEFKLCYKFSNNTNAGIATPWKLYEGMRVQVREFYNVVSADFGDKNVAIAHRQKSLSLNGFGVSDNDQVKWISKGENCSENNLDFVTYDDKEWWEH